MSKKLSDLADVYFNDHRGTSQSPIRSPEGKMIGTTMQEVEYFSITAQSQQGYLTEIASTPQPVTQPHLDHDALLTVFDCVFKYLTMEELLHAHLHLQKPAPTSRMPVLKPSFASCETRCVLNTISVQHYESKDTRSLLGASSKFLCIAMAIDDEHADVEMKAMTQLRTDAGNL